MIATGVLLIVNQTSEDAYNTTKIMGKYNDAITFRIAPPKVAIVVKRTLNWRIRGEFFGDQLRNINARQTTKFHFFIIAHDRFFNVCM